MLACALHPGARADTPPPSGVDQQGCLVWDDSVRDSGATPTANGGAVAPHRACIKLVESSHDNFDLAYHRDEPPMPVPGSPGCGADTPSRCPPEPKRVPSLKRFPDPYGATPVTTPSGACLDGEGWSFETRSTGLFDAFAFGAGRFEGWTPGPGQPGTDSAFGDGGACEGRCPGPVYGNNVSIDRITPPGYDGNSIQARPLTNIGGDYWEWSRDINYRGNYWIGSSDVREDATVDPGARLPESATGTLTSPSFVISGPYVSFYIGGIPSTAERVELQVRESNPERQHQLRRTFEGIGTVEFPSQGSSAPYYPTDIADGTWVVVRSATPPQPSNDYMQRRVVWNVSSYAGMKARYRIVDDATDGRGHINVDHFLCHDQAPEGTEWAPRPTGGGTVPSAVGYVAQPMPLWGTTDAHGHAVANTAFGGHFIWGDVTDSLKQVYNCAYPLPELKDRLGRVLRRATGTPSISSSCSVNVDITAFVLGAAIELCSQVSFVPLVGQAAAAVCVLTAVDAAWNISTTPVLTMLTLHGASRATSGHVRLGDWLRRPFKNLADVDFGFVEDKDRTEHGVVETIDWDMPGGGHSGRSLGKLHQQYQWQMIRRAWQGGLRLMVIDSINSRMMQYLLDGQSDYDDWQAIRDGIEAAKRYVTGPSDPTYFPGPLASIAEIAYTPRQARQIIAKNKIAIVLGTEVDELGKLRSPTDSVEKQVDDLMALGIRKITPIHGANNPYGGSGMFRDIYDSLNYYNNLTRDEDGHLDGSWKDFSPVMITVPDSFPPPFRGMKLGEFVIGKELRPELDAGHLDPSGIGAEPQLPWNLRNHGYFRVDPATGSSWIGGEDLITYRVGFAEAKDQVWNFSENGTGVNWSPPVATLFRPVIANSLSWLLGASPGSSTSNSRCSLIGLFIPEKPKVDELPASAMANYAKVGKGHRNDLGLQQAGRTAAGRMMRNAMLVDLDHLGQKARTDIYDEARHVAAVAFSAPQGSNAYHYPFVGVHTGMRDYDKSGPVPFELRQEFGYAVENDRTKAEFARARLARSSVAPLASAGGAFIRPDHPDMPSQLNVDCDYSSKSWAARYLLMLKLMGGHGVTPSLDMNGLTTPLASRFGAGASCHSDDKAHRYDTSGAYRDSERVGSWPRDFTDASLPGLPPAPCTFNTLTQTWDPACESSKMVSGQLAEFSGVEYDDYDLQSHWSVVPWAQSDPKLKVVVARGPTQRRDDDAPRAKIEEIVAYGGARQMRPLTKFKNTGAAVVSPLENTGWDINLDGLRHVGMYPDFLQDVRNVGVSWEQMGPLFNAAEEYIRTWERACEIATRYRTLSNLPPLPPNVCD